MVGAAPAAPAFGGLGAQQPQQGNPQQAALHAHQSASQRQEAARIEEAIFNLLKLADPGLNPGKFKRLREAGRRNFLL